MIKVGLVGYGFVTKTFHIPLIAATDGIEVAAIASSRPNIVKTEQPSLAVFSDAAEMFAISEIDVVVVTSTNDTHVEYARAALNAGKHVVIEKPVAPTLAEARQLMELADKMGRIATVFQNRRWDTDYLSVKKAIETGQVGRVVHFESHFDRFQAAVRARFWERPGVVGSGIWFDLAPHLVDQTLQLFGLPDCIQLNLATLRSDCEVDDWAHAILQYADKRVVLNASVLVAGGSPRFIVHGDRGSLVKPRLDGQEKQLLAGVVPGTSDWGQDDDPLLLWDASGTMRSIDAERGDQRRFYQCLVTALKDGTPPPVQAHEIIAVMAVIEAGRISSVRNSAAALDLTNTERAAWAAPAFLNDRMLAGS